MNKTIDVVIISYIIGVIAGTVMSYLYNNSVVLLEGNQLFIALKSFASSLLLLWLAVKIGKSKMLSYGYLFLLGLTSGYVLFVLLKTYTIWIVLYKTMTYVILIFSIIIFNIINFRRKDVAIPIIIISLVYALLNYFIN